MQWTEGSHVSRVPLLASATIDLTWHHGCSNRCPISSQCSRQGASEHFPKALVVKQSPEQEEHGICLRGRHLSFG